ncbi:cytidine deaminase [Treponema parvum]|uniref:cytidine deaminase n=1 Tax=Treponema parvum TaxID=138851 RepID=UPI001AEBDC39|nr:cytidine deaminase [Treponema parvum]QTQ16979.1 cytidine deaminase [Treponema parvum]
MKNVSISGDIPVKKLIEKALEMLQFSYTPYSHWKVGAALLCADGKIWGGCNIENAAYTPSNCAERTAFFNAVSAGEKEFKAIAVVGGSEGNVSSFCFPCGVCRQVMMEFCEPEDFIVIVAKNTDEYRINTLKELLPDGFGPMSLKM